MLMFLHLSSVIDTYLIFGFTQKTEFLCFNDDNSTTEQINIAWKWKCCLFTLCLMTCTINKRHLVATNVEDSMKSCIWLLQKYSWENWSASLNLIWESSCWGSKSWFWMSTKSSIHFRVNTFEPCVCTHKTSAKGADFARWALSERGSNVHCRMICLQCHF